MTQMWTKLRPGVRAFLEAAHERYELHIYTMGDRDYAAEMAARLDPKRRLFAERIISSVNCCRADGVRAVGVRLVGGPHAGPDVFGAFRWRATSATCHWQSALGQPTYHS